MERGWKSGKIEEILISLFVIGWKDGKVEGLNFFYLVKKKISG